MWLDWSAGINQNVWRDYQDLLEDLHGRVRKVIARGKREKLLPKDFNTMAATRLYIGSGHTLQLMIFMKCIKATNVAAKPLRDSKYRILPVEIVDCYNMLKPLLF